MIQILFFAQVRELVGVDKLQLAPSFQLLKRYVNPCVNGVSAGSWPLKRANY